jgi:hypothetical protein
MYNDLTNSDDKNTPLFFLPGMATRVDLSYKELQEQMKHDEEPPCPDKNQE